jgi:hypothetical protein
MTVKERLLNCLYGRPVDRVPISTYELVGHNQDAWENQEPSYQRLMEVIRTHTDCLYMAQPDWIQPEQPYRTSESWREGYNLGDEGWSVAKAGQTG